MRRADTLTLDKQSCLRLPTKRRSLCHQLLGNCVVASERDQCGAGYMAIRQHDRHLLIYCLRRQPSVDLDHASSARSFFVRVSIGAKRLYGHSIQPRCGRLLAHKIKARRGAVVGGVAGRPAAPVDRRGSSVLARCTRWERLARTATEIC